MVENEAFIIVFHLIKKILETKLALIKSFVILISQFC